MRRTIYNYGHIALLICLALIIFMGNLLGDQLGPYIGYIADVRYDEIIQQFLLRAATEYEIAKIKDPDSAISHNNLGVVYRIKSELKDAESEFNTALKKDEKFAGATMNLGVVLAAQGRIDEAIATHLKALDNALDWLKPQIYYNLGSLYDEKGEFDKALTEYERAISHEKAGVNIIAKAHVGSGVIYARRGDYDLAKKEFEDALALTPNGEAGVLAEKNLAILPKQIETYIKAVAVSGSPASSGKQIIVTLLGSPDSVVKFSIEKVVSDVIMKEETPGVYVGWYEVKGAINVDDAPVIVTLTTPSGKTRKDTSQKVTIDTVAKIDSVTLSGKAVKVGDKISITAQAEPYGKVNFSIDGIVSNAPMTEQEKGKYVGYYTVKEGDAATNSIVRVNLEDRAGNKVSDTSKKITITSRKWAVTFVNRDEKELKEGDAFWVDLVLTDSEDVFGFQIDFSFEPKVLTVQEVVEGGFLKSDGSQTFWHEPTIENDEGMIKGIMSVRQGSTAGLKGGGVLASIHFQTKALGKSPLIFKKSDFATPSGSRLEGIIPQDGVVQVGSMLSTAAAAYNEPDLTGDIKPKNKENIPGSILRTALLQNYPNPCNPDTRIPYRLSSDTSVEIMIYHVDGRLIRKLDLGYKTAGSYISPTKAAYWDGNNEYGERVVSGIYFYTLKAGEFVETKRLVVMK